MIKNSLRIIIFFLKKIFKKIKDVNSIIELGPNNGFNLIALKNISKFKKKFTR